MEPSIRLGKFFGIKVGLNYSLILIAALVTWQLTIELPYRSPGFSDDIYLWYALVGAVLFFFSILWHEMAHAVMAQIFGIRVKQIVLFFLGGIAEIESEPRRAYQEFWIAIIGPLSSLLLGGIFLGLREFFHEASVMAAMLWWLGTINLILAAFNMLPGFPLDGGRVLRAVIWFLTGSYLRSSQVSSYLGQGIGGVLLLGGAALIFLLQDFTGLYLLFLGMFFLNASRAQLNFAQARAGLSGVAVGQLINGDTRAVDAEWPIGYAIDMMSVGAARSAAPVLHNGNMIGIFPIDTVRTMPPMQRINRRVKDVMLPMQSVGTIDARLDLFDALHRLELSGQPYLLVTLDQHPIGLISQREMLRVRDRLLQQI